MLGLQHDWFKIPAGDVTDTVAMFAISWAVIFLLLMIASFRLPVIYTAIIGLVVVALALVAVAYLRTPVSESTLNAAGVVVFAFAALGGWVFLSVGSRSLGGGGLPMGRPIIRASEPS